MNKKFENNVDISIMKFENNVTICICSMSRAEIALRLGLLASDPQLTDTACQNFVEWFKDEEDVADEGLIALAAQHAGIIVKEVDNGQMRSFSMKDKEEIKDRLLIALPSIAISSFRDEDLEIEYIEEVSRRKYEFSLTIGTDMSKEEWGRAPWFNIGINVEGSGCFIFEGGPQRNVEDLVRAIVGSIKDDSKWKKYLKL